DQDDARDQRSDRVTSGVDVPGSGAPPPESPSGSPPVVSLAPGTRRWSPQAAMEPLPPLSPPRPRVPAVEPRPGWGMTAIVAVAVLAAVVIVVISRGDWVGTSGPASAYVAPPLTVGALRATSASSAHDA